MFTIKLKQKKKGIVFIMFKNLKNKINSAKANFAMKLCNSKLAKKDGALNMIEIIIILVVVCALAVIFKSILDGTLTDIGAQIKEATENLFN